jgi:hypothetical protein
LLKKFRSECTHRDAEMRNTNVMQRTQFARLNNNQRMGNPMNATSKWLTVLVLRLSGPVVAIAQADSGLISDGGFEQPSVGTDTYYAYQYQPTGTAWVFGSQSGIQGNGSAWSGPLLCGCGTGLLGPNAPEGVQTAFIQSTGDGDPGGSYISQSFNLDQASTLSLSFALAERTNYQQGGPQTIEVLLDGEVVGSYTAPNVLTYEQITLSKVAAGAHTLEFLGTNDNQAADTTALIDIVTIAPLPPTTVSVPGTDAIWLAGQPDGSQSPAASPGQETAPQNSPLLIRLPSLPTATGLQFSVTGGTNIATCCGPLVGADGYIGPDHPPYGELTNYFNLSIIMAPQASLVGVFFNSQETNPTPGGLSFVDPSSATSYTNSLLPDFTGGNYGINFSTLAPQLQQIFFIGDGLTGTGTGTIQQFFIPAGADELFLATLDQGNFDNIGALQVTVATVPPVTLACPAATTKVGMPYSSTLTAAGGISPYTFSNTGNLPGGLSLNPNTGAVTGTPSVPGSFSFAAQVVDSSGSAARTVASNCIINVGPSPQAQISAIPNPLAFGNQIVGTQSPPIAVNVTDTGGVAVEIASVSVNGGNVSQFTQSNNCVGMLPIGGTCMISAAFEPTFGGIAASTIEIVGPALGIHLVSLTGNGIAASYSFTPTVLQFGTEENDVASAAHVVKLLNTGPIPLPIVSIAIGGASLSQYSEENNCVRTVSVGASCTISVVFKPTSRGSKTASLIVDAGDGGGVRSVPLTGTSVVPTFAVAPMSLSFGTVTPGTSSPAKSIHVTNTGTFSLPIDSISLSGRYPSDYTETNTCGKVLAGNAICSIRVIFRPVSKGSKPATLTIKGGDGAGTKSITLAGIGN